MTTRKFNASLSMKCLLALVIACCMMVISTGSAFAASVADKHQEVDRILFEEYTGDFAEQGFTVTHTAPLHDRVEVGITPLKEEYVSYMYTLLGEDMVEVVEGVQAVTLNSPAITNDAVVTNAPIVDNEARTIAYQEPVTTSTSNSNSIWILSSLAVLIMVGGIVFVLRKRQATSS